MANEAENRFQDFVSVSLGSGAMLACADERALIADGIARFQLSADRARGILAVIADRDGKVRESEIARDMARVMRGLGGKCHIVDRKRFETGLVVLQSLHGERLTDGEGRAWLKRIVEQCDMRIARAGMFRSRRWFRRIRPTT